MFLKNFHSVCVVHLSLLVSEKSSSSPVILHWSLSDPTWTFDANNLNEVCSRQMYRLWYFA